MAVAAAVSLPAALHGQIVIEGGPSQVQIADQDGKPEPVDNTISVPGVNPALGAEEIQTLPPTTPETVVMQPSPFRDTTVVVPMKEKTNDPIEEATVNQVTAIAEVKVEDAISVTAMKRMEEIETELEIFDAAETKVINLATENLFDSDGVMIEPVAESTLALIVEYMGLLNPDKVDVTYHYVSGDLADDTAWKRSVKVVNWLKSVREGSDAEFEINQPEVVTEQRAVENAPDPIALQLQPYLTLVMR